MDRDIRANRRTALAVIAAAVALPAMVAPQPRATLELTTARISLLLETGPVRFRTFVSETARPAGLKLSIGSIT